MPVDADTAFRALQARDPRFDGRLWVGVTSTGVYCRPICRVRTPRRENCRFFDSPAQAEAARFRPCLKCRPELAPGAGLAWTVMDASRTLARQAAAALDRMAFESPADGPAVLAAARRLGISDRHLRRIFTAEHGVTPVQYLQTRRLLHAKHLLTDSTLPVTQVALAAGFGSLRRFHAAFAERYRLSPLALRRSGGDASGLDGAALHAAGRRPAGEPAAPAVVADPAPPPAAVDLLLAYRPPYDLDTLLRFFERRSVPGVESVDPAAARVRRTLRAGIAGPPGAPTPAGWLEVRFEPARDRVRLRLAPALAPWSATLGARVRGWLDLDADPLAIGAGPDGDVDATRLPVGPPGLRLPGATDGFEIAVRAVLGQRVTVAAARTIAGRVVREFGQPIDTPWPDVAVAFPSPDVLAGADAERLGRLGLLRRQVAAIQALALIEPELRAIECSDEPSGARAERLVARLVELPGLGPWTAHYLAMRRLGWTDAFPPGDVAVLNALGLGRDAASLREAARRAEAWRPWRAHAVLRLWHSLETPR